MDKDGGRMMKLTELAKWTNLVREKTIFPFIGDWKHFMDFLHKKFKNELVMYHFNN